MKDLVEARQLTRYFPVPQTLVRGRARPVRAVDGVDLRIREGECLAIVGESGSGKSTLGRCLLALEEITEGRVLFDGTDLFAMAPAELRRRRREFQMVFQDPAGSLDPRMTIGRTLAEPLQIHRIGSSSGRRERVLALLQQVGVAASAEHAYPHELSGGQKQRIAIARALAPSPRFLVADEPVSALDASLRGQITNLLVELRAKLNLTLLLIAHDLAFVRQIADRVGVMYAGRIVELGVTERLYEAPQHPYTVSLLSAMPRIEQRSRRNRIVLSGEPPNPADWPAGCRFHPRCPICEDRCRRQPTVTTRIAEGHEVACHYPGELQ